MLDDMMPQEEKTEFGEFENKVLFYLDSIDKGITTLNSMLYMALSGEQTKPLSEMKCPTCGHKGEPNSLGYCVKCKTDMTKGITNG